MNEQIYNRVKDYCFSFIALIIFPISLFAPIGTWAPVVLSAIIILLGIKFFWTDIKENEHFKILIVFLTYLLLSTLFFNTQDMHFEKLIHFTILVFSGFILISTINKSQNLKIIVLLFSISLIICALFIIVDLKFRLGIKFWLSSNLDSNNFHNFYTIKKWIGLQDFKNNYFDLKSKIYFKNHIDNMYDRGMAVLAVLSFPLAALCFKYNYNFLSGIILLVSFITATFFYNLTIFISYIFTFLILIIFFLTKKTFTNVILILLGIYCLVFPFLAGSSDYKKFAFYQKDINEKLQLLEKKYTKVETRKCSNFEKSERGIDAKLSVYQDKTNGCFLYNGISLYGFINSEKNFSKFVDMIILKKLLFEDKFLHRSMIWSYTKEKILERPLVGHGFFSSRFIGEDYKINDIKNDKISAIPLHPHNFIMQVWLELGLLGVIVLYFFIYNLIKRLKPFTEKQFYLSAFPVVSFIQVFFIGQLSYGFWQSWWIAIIIINFMLYSILFADEVEVRKPLLK